jgi:hypothetical protein
MGLCLIAHVTDTIEFRYRSSRSICSTPRSGHSASYLHEVASRCLAGIGVTHGPVTERLQVERPASR